MVFECLFVEGEVVVDDFVVAEKVDDDGVFVVFLGEDV